MLLFVCFSAFRSNDTHTITGTVTDEKGNAIPYATVSVKGRITSASCNVNGLYSINVADYAKVLVFGAVGYDTKEVSIGNSNVINVMLHTSEMHLQEVVVTAYGIRRNYQFKNAKPYKPPVGYRFTPNDFNTEEYSKINENTFHKVTDEPLSTFSIDVDAASYGNMRRFLRQGSLPPVDAVRIEELVNYFRYDYAQPTGKDPFSIHTEISVCPWNMQHQLVLIGLQGKKIAMDDLPPSNLVFLIDVSGSMSTPDKLPLVKSSMKMLVEQLREQDMISIVTYAGSAGLVLPPVSGSRKMDIRAAIERMESGGSTAGGEGIELAYKIARENFMENGNNRIILCTDGDFNVGVSSDSELERMVEQERESGVYLTVLGYGMGNYKDSKMQGLADIGNGNHAYIDGEMEAKKVLVNEFGGTLFTIAKDVKLQVEFNPLVVQGYRLIGYENRMLNKEDFNNDKKDAGELGSGHTVTALYEIIPAGVKDEFLKDVDPLKYQKPKEQNAHYSNEMLTVKFRYKDPGGFKSKLITHPVPADLTTWDQASENFRFAASVAEFGLLLRNSTFKSSASFDHVVSTAVSAKGKDTEGYRTEFIELVKVAEEIKKHGKDMSTIK